MLLSRVIRNDEKKKQKMEKEIASLENQINGNNSDMYAELDQLIEEKDKFVSDVYARDVYEHFSKKKPDVIRKKTGERFTWEEAFGKDFDSISKTIRLSLVGLVEGEGRYELAK